MQINNSDISFKGYDARKLKGLMFTDSKYANAVAKAIRNSDVDLDIFTPQITSKSVRKEYQFLVDKNSMIWAQDYFTFLKRPFEAVLADNTREVLQRSLKGIAGGIKNVLGTKAVPTDPHLRGGNFFICDNNGKREMLLLKDRNIYPHDFIKQLYEVENVIELPRLDYHLDLFIRPLDDGKILVSDNEMTKNALKLGIKKIDKYLAENTDDVDAENLKKISNNLDLLVQKMEITEKHDKYKPKETVHKVVDILQNAGYKPIKVPGSYYYLEGIKVQDKVNELNNNFNKNAKAVMDYASAHGNRMENFAKNWIIAQKIMVDNDPNFGVELVNKYENNFINAIVTKQNNKLIYITNDSLFDEKYGITPEIERKIGFSTKKMFIDSIKDCVNEEDIHFIDKKSTENLFKFFGGIHCAASEIPLF